MDIVLLDNFAYTGIMGKLLIRQSILWPIFLPGIICIDCTVIEVKATEKNIPPCFRIRFNASLRRGSLATNCLVQPSSFNISSLDALLSIKFISSSGQSFFRIDPRAQGLSISFCCLKGWGDL